MCILLHYNVIRIYNYTNQRKNGPQKHSQRVYYFQNFQGEHAPGPLEVTDIAPIVTNISPLFLDSVCLIVLHELSSAFIRLASRYLTDEMSDIV